MELIVERGAAGDIDELALLYDDLVDYLVAGTNYPGWIKGIYPTRETAACGVSNGRLYVVRLEGKIVGSVVLNHEQEPAYHTVEWGMDARNEDILVVHTLVVHPNHPRCGIGERLMELATEVAREQKMKAIRLDVHENNFPAISLYQKCGFQYVGTVSLGFERYGLKFYKLFEKML